MDSVGNLATMRQGEEFAYLGNTYMDSIKGTFWCLLK